MITGLFRDMHEYQFPAWKDHKVSFIFCTKLAREQSSSLSRARSVANPQHRLELMGRGLQGCPEGPPAKAAPIQGAGSQSLVKQILHMPSVSLFRSPRLSFCIGNCGEPGRLRRYIFLDKKLGK